MKLIGELLKWGYSEARVQQINFKFYLQASHFFSSCIDIRLSCYKLVHVVICLQVGTCCLCVVICLQVGTRCLCVVICLQVGTRCHLFTSTRCLLFTRVYNGLQVHVSPRSDVTFGNDVALHKTLHKNRLESVVIYY